MSGVISKNIVIDYASDAEIAGLIYNKYTDACYRNSGPETIDGAPVIPGDLVLLKDQTDKQLNGLWKIAKNDATKFSIVREASYRYEDNCFQVTKGTNNVGLVFSLTTTSKDVDTREVTATQKATGGAPPVVVPLMTGATAAVNGTQGQMIAPLAGDENKAFFGDGTYKTVAVGVGIGPTLPDPATASLFRLVGNAFLPDRLYWSNNNAWVES